MARIATTMRFPFCRAVIAWPDREGLGQPLWLLHHERVHVDQFEGPWGLIKTYLLYTLLPLPVLFSGRWFVEREAFLVDIRAGVKTPQSAADMLWASYLFPWPKSWMVAWFEANR